MLERFSIRQRLYFVVFMILVLFAEMVLFSSSSVNSAKDIGTTASATAMLEGQKQRLMLGTTSMALSLGELIKGEADREAKIDAIRKALNPIRYEEDRSGYYFVYQDTTNIANPPKKSVQGKNLKDAKDPNGVYVIRELRNQAAAGGGFVEYIWPKPGAGEQPKISYAMMIPGTDLWIGTGVYIDNIEAKRLEIERTIDGAVSAKTVFMYTVSGAIFLFILVLVVVITRGIVKPLRSISEGLTKGADEVSSAAEEVSSAGQSLANGASEQAATVEESSASLEELHSMTQQNAGNAAQADSLMKESAGMAEQADRSMKALTQSIKEISDAGEETQKIIKTIDEIAFQTNLLALNAAVEAARAGESGAGFAVVADEVRNLAMRAAEAAKDTAQLIEGTVKKTTDGSALVSQTNDAFRHMMESSGKVADLVAEVAAATKEQSVGIDQINKAVTEIDKVTQQNAANAEESAAASEELSAQAEQMKAFVRDLVGIVEGSGGARPTGDKTAPARVVKTTKASTSKAAPTKSVNTSAEKVIPFDEADKFEDF